MSDLNPLGRAGDALPFVKHDAGKPRTDLLPPLALLKVADVLGFGALEYAPDNWSKAPSRDTYVAAAIRHLLQYQSGEDTDADSGLPHLAHAGCCVLFALEMHLRGWGRDDRLRAPSLDINLTHADLCPKCRSLLQRGECVARGCGRGE